MTAPVSVFTRLCGQSCSERKTGANLLVESARIMVTAVEKHTTERVPFAVMYQNWERLAFVHWRADASQLRRRLPRHIELDTFDGEAWLGLTPFHLTGLRPPLVPALPWISRFPETNLRTYVRGHDGTPGIWFFSLESSRVAAVVGARIGYGLPYRWARMSVRQKNGDMLYRSRRHFARGETNIGIRTGPPIEADERADFLTARFRLYTTIGGRLAYADVAHEPWPLRQAEAIALEQNLTGVHELITRGEPLVHFSEGVHTRIGPPRFA